MSSSETNVVESEISSEQPSCSFTNTNYSDLRKDFNELKTINELLTKDKDDLNGSIINLKTKHKETIDSMKQDIQNSMFVSDSKFKDQEKQLAIFQKQPDSVYELIQLYSSNYFENKLLQRTLIESSILNASRKKRIFSSIEKDFWVDLYNNLSHSLFDKVAENMNGPWRGAVCKWRGKQEACTFGLNFSKIESLASAKTNYQPIVNTTINELDIDSFSWGDNTNTKKIQNTTPFNCMIDETATKIVIEFNPTDYRPLWIFSNA